MAFEVFGLVKNQFIPSFGQFLGLDIGAIFDVCNHYNLNLEDKRILVDKVKRIEKVYYKKYFKKQDSISQKKPKGKK